MIIVASMQLECGGEATHVISVVWIRIHSNRIHKSLCILIQIQVNVITKLISKTNLKKLLIFKSEPKPERIAIV